MRDRACETRMFCLGWQGAAICNMSGHRGLRHKSLKASADTRASRQPRWASLFCRRKRTSTGKIGIVPEKIDWIFSIVLRHHAAVRVQEGAPSSQNGSWRRIWRMVGLRCADSEKRTGTNWFFLSTKYKPLSTPDFLPDLSYRRWQIQRKSSYNIASSISKKSNFD